MKTKLLTILLIIMMILWCFVCFEFCKANNIKHIICYPGDVAIEETENNYLFTVDNQEIKVDKDNIQYKYSDRDYIIIIYNESLLVNNYCIVYEKRC